MRNYSRIKDNNLLTPKEKHFKDRNLRIADLRAQGESYTSIAKTIFLEYGELVSTQRIAELIQKVKKWKEGDK